jgi:hypothetical protein
VKKRKVAINSFNQRSNLDWIKEDLMKKDGMISIDIDIRKGVLKLTYDLQKIKFEQIEKSITDIGLKISQRFLERVKRGMAKYTEQNELDNLNTPLSSCCNDPKGEDRHCKRSMS